jgi:hypothetical protein
MMELIQTSFLSSEWDPEDLILVSYLINCVVDAKSDPIAFKKIVAAKDKDNLGRQNKLGLELRDLWVTRMQHRRDELLQAARRWAGITNGGLVLKDLNPFWDGKTPPSIISLPHIAAQALLEQVSSALFSTYYSIHG